MSNQPSNESKCCSSCLRTDPTSPNNGDFSKFCVNASCSCHKEKCYKVLSGNKNVHCLLDCCKECHPTNKEWETAFEELFGLERFATSKVKDFIRSVLLSERKKAYEEGRQALRDELCKKIEGMKYNASYKKTGKLKGGGMIRDYNAALDKAIEIIRGKE